MQIKHYWKIYALRNGTDYRVNETDKKVGPEKACNAEVERLPFQAR